ncbi:hypothetical protein EVAR_32660_1 [Eumeta japonica]|uniref:Uncharacterized protein n=1 Tax=Eumeta variegata TaxID=151549 RepID=A0A4C1WTR3_EUMVA|nr:hypothetical protein EVAR_32660_1 [Eumeta japonica]
MRVAPERYPVNGYPAKARIQKARNEGWSAFMEKIILSHQVYWKVSICNSRQGTLKRGLQAGRTVSASRIKFIHLMRSKHSALAPAT